MHPQLLDADAIVFISPIYYYAMNAQIKAVVDRFYANDAALHKNKKAVRMVTMADDTMESAERAVAAFKGTTNYLEWEIAGILVGMGCGDVDTHLFV